MKYVIFISIFLASLLQTAVASPQHPWLFELHVGPSGTDASISDADVGVGFEFGGMISYHFFDNRIGPYFGWSVNGFNADSNEFSELDWIVYRRLSFGISYNDFLTEDRLGYYVRAGVTSGHLELNDDDDNELADTDSGMGFEAMAGVTYPMKGNWRLHAGVIYSSLSESLDDVAGNSNADIDTITANIGWSLSF